MAAEVAGERLKQLDPLPASARAKLLWIMGSGLSLSEEHVAALSALDEGELLARQLDDKKLLRRILRFEAAAACETADYARGRDAALEALQLSEVLNDKTAYVAILHNEVANNESALGNLDSAASHLHAVDQIAQEHGDAKLQAMALASLAGLLGRMDRHEEAVNTGRKVLRIGDEESQGLVFAATYANLADSLLRLDRADEAELHLASAIQLCSQQGSDSIRGTVESVSGRLQLIRGDVASGIAHDFNNLLCGIAGLAELGGLSAQPKRKDELFQEITSTSLKASGLTGQLMQFLGRPADETVPSDVVAVVESSKSLLQSVARSSSPVEIHSTTDSLVAAIDETRLRQVLVNLVSNSADASDDGGQILITIGRCVLDAPDLPNMTVAADARPGEFCRIVVQDAGSGMTETVRRKLFDPYFSTKAVGRGLGLASVMGIVRACCGCIDVKSEPDQGCRISVFIPVAEQSLPLATPAIRRIDPEHRPQRKESSHLILFVDDEILLLDCHSEILERFGYRVLTATSADEALTIASDQLAELQCVVTDYSMPDHDGVWLAARLRERRSNLPVIVCTGLGDNELAGDQNLSRILAKPFSSQLLVSTIRELTGGPEIPRTPSAQRNTDRLIRS